MEDFRDARSVELAAHCWGGTFPVTGHAVSV